MKASALTAAALLAAALAACASPASRIREHQAEFDAYPPAVQRKIRDGQVDLGFTRRQVTLALGRPDRVYNRKIASAAQQEVWGYGTGVTGPRAVDGPGPGPGAAGPGFYGGGIGAAGDPGIDRGESVRVVFQDGLVVAFDSRRK
jgi:hypothetical protein